MSDRSAFRRLNITLCRFWIGWLVLIGLGVWATALLAGPPVEEESKPLDA